MKDKDVLVVGAMRGPIGTGTSKSALKSLTPQNFALQVLDALFIQSGAPREAVEIFRLGSNVSLKSEYFKQAPDREIALLAGMHNASSNLSQKACSSGLLAISEAMYALRYGGAELAVCGGLDMMSNAPETANIGALTDPLTKKTMAQLSDEKACELGFTREDQDRYAFESFERAKKHLNDYQLSGYLTPVFTPDDPEAMLLNFDQNVTLKDITFEKINNPRAPLVEGCKITTPYNSSKYGDAAAFLMLATPRAARKYKLKPIAKLLAYAENSLKDPKDYIVAPVGAILKALEKTGLCLYDIDIFWINEAFSPPPLNFMRGFGDLTNERLGRETVNPWGGAIAFGHALGATGAVLPVNAICQARREKKKYVVVAVCNAIAEATSAVFEIF